MLSDHFRGQAVLGKLKEEAMKVKSNLLRVAQLISKLEALNLVDGNYTFNQINRRSFNFVIFGLNPEACNTVSQMVAQEFSDERKLIIVEDGSVSCHIY